MNRILSALFFVCFIATVSRAQIVTDADEIFKVARQTGKPVLLVFAGSDWCAPCVRFERNVLNTSSFETFANEQLVVYQADFPQRKKLSKEIQRKNESLADKYNPRGEFPHLVLINGDKTVLTPVVYNDEPVEEFIHKLRSLIDHEQAKGVSKTK